MIDGPMFESMVSYAKGLPFTLAQRSRDKNFNSIGKQCQFNNVMGKALENDCLNIY
jgi:hypothetical protein